MSNKPQKNFRRNHQQLCDEYDKMYKEFDADNPMYCGNAARSAFMGKFKRLKHKVTCKNCSTESCAACRLLMREHKGVHKLCPDDIDDSMMKEAVATYGMNRCPKCFIVVDKNGGCNNITCKCGAMFCYRCGQQKQSEMSQCGCIKVEVDEFDELLGLD